jgi:hypothetical protein
MVSVAVGAFWYLICHSASDYSAPAPEYVGDSALAGAFKTLARKNGPENRGHSSKVSIDKIGYAAESRRCRTAKCRPQSPKYGRSPLRIAMRALVMSKRSIEAIRRPKKVLE